MMLFLIPLHGWISLSRLFPRGGNVAKHSVAIIATDASDNQHQAIIDVTTHLLSRAHAMRCDDMQLPNMVTTYNATEELYT